MPQGILILKWDNEIGPVLITSYPTSLKITNNLLTQIYSAHRYSSLEPGFSSLTLKNNKIVSFFSGLGENHIEVENYIVALLLRRDEKVNKYREILNKIAANILSNIENNKYKKIISKLYDDLSKV
ncbi:MAG: hypothetical protein GY870_22205 [archaeon]|nr:hypothetical protein [archaeon]